MAQLKTLLLDRDQWDLVLDSAGNIALAEAPYSLVQDVASAVRLFKAELYYNTAKGVPYFEDILGQLPPQSLLAALMEQAALTVPGVVAARVVISSFDQREIHGQVQFVDDLGADNAVIF